MLPRLPGGDDDPDDVIDDRVVHEHTRRRRLQPLQLAGADHRIRDRRLDAHPVDDLALLGRRRVIDGDLHQEPVPLRLGQRVDTLGLDRVLGGQHQERLRHVVLDAADGDVPLGHHLEQRRLHLRRRTVDLVGQHKVGHDRAELGVEAFGAGPVDAGADDVGRHQVRGELKAGERAADGAGEGLDGERLGDTGHALEQAVALREQAHHHALDEPLLADDHPLDLEHHPFEGGGVGGRCMGGRCCHLGVSSAALVDQLHRTGRRR